MFRFHRNCFRAARLRETVLDFRFNATTGFVFCCSRLRSERRRRFDFPNGHWSAVTFRQIRQMRASNVETHKTPSPKCANYAQTIRQTCACSNVLLANEARFPFREHSNVRVIPAVTNTFTNDYAGVRRKRKKLIHGGFGRFDVRIILFPSVCVFLNITKL